MFKINGVCLFHRYRKHVEVNKEDRMKWTCRKCTRCGTVKPKSRNVEFLFNQNLTDETDKEDLA